MDSTAKLDTTLPEGLPGIGRIRLNTGGLIVADDPETPGDFVLLNHNWPQKPRPFTRLPARHVPEMAAFMRDHGKGGRTASLRQEGLAVGTWPKGFVISNDPDALDAVGVRIWHNDVPDVLACLSPAQESTPAICVTEDTPAPLFWLCIGGWIILGLSLNLLHAEHWQWWYYVLAVPVILSLPWLFIGMLIPVAYTQQVMQRSGSAWLRDRAESAVWIWYAILIGSALLFLP